MAPSLCCALSYTPQAAPSCPDAAHSRPYLARLEAPHRPGRFSVPGQCNMCLLHGAAKVQPRNPNGAAGTARATARPQRPKGARISHRGRDAEHKQTAGTARATARPQRPQGARISHRGRDAEHRESTN